MDNEIPEEANAATPEDANPAVPEPTTAESDSTAEADSVVEKQAESAEAAADEQAASSTEDAEQPTSSEDGSDLPDLTLGEGGPAGEESSEPAAAPLIRGKIDRFGVAMGTGRRKTSVARVRVKAGDGSFVINGKPLEEYSVLDRDRLDIQAPLRATDTREKVDVWVRVNGGGTTGQAGAIVLGIARALQAMDPSLHHRLAEGGFLTRDSRMVERKKYGFRKARRSFQFSKR
jgi:small subunit ribosomal protein S9